MRINSNMENFTFLGYTNLSIVSVYIVQYDQRLNRETVCALIMQFIELFAEPTPFHSPQAPLG